MVPGVSRSAASIVGGLVNGLSRAKLLNFLPFAIPHGAAPVMTSQNRLRFYRHDIFLFSLDL